MEIAIGLIALGSCIGCTVCGCRNHRRIKKIEARLLSLDQENKQQKQLIQMKQLIQESMINYQPQPSALVPSASSQPLRFSPVKVMQD